MKIQDFNENSRFTAMCFFSFSKISTSITEKNSRIQEFKMSRIQEFKISRLSTSIMENAESIPRRKRVMKKRKQNTLEPARSPKACGYAIKASPGPPIMVRVRVSVL